MHQRKHRSSCSILGHKLTSLLMRHPHPTPPDPKQTITPVDKQLVLCPLGPSCSVVVEASTGQIALVLGVLGQQLDPWHAYWELCSSKCRTGQKYQRTATVDRFGMIWAEAHVISSKSTQYAHITHSDNHMAIMATETTTTVADR